MLTVYECWLFVNVDCLLMTNAVLNEQVWKQLSPWRLFICCVINFTGCYCVTMEIADAHNNVYVQETFSSAEQFGT